MRRFSGKGSTKVCSQSGLCGNAPINSGISTFEDWIVQVPAPSGQNGVQMPYPIVGFVCHTLLKKNRRRLLLSLIKTFFVSQSLTNAASLPLKSFPCIALRILTVHNLLRH